MAGLGDIDTHRILAEETREQLDEQGLRPLWELMAEIGNWSRYDLDPQVWEWDAYLEFKTDIEDVPRDLADRLPFERRALDLVNHAHGTSVGPTLFIGIQSYPPGDAAIPHRHPHQASRFVVEGHEGFKAVVDGEPIPARTNDLILTPSWSWHGHVNDGDETGIWLSPTDISFVVEGLGLTEDEHWNEVHGEDTTKDPVDKEAGYHNKRAGLLQPDTSSATLEPTNTVPYRFAWEDCYPALMQAATESRAETYDPYDGVSMAYVNPASGRPPVSPTMGMRLQLIEGETAAHKHNALEVFYVVQGSGRTHVQGEEQTELTWSAKDLFTVPPGRFHSHEPDEETILYAMTDEPILQAFDLYTEEGE